jgi:hypothetical protein
MVTMNLEDKAREFLSMSQYVAPYGPGENERDMLNEHDEAVKEIVALLQTVEREGRASGYAEGFRAAESYAGEFAPEYYRELDRLRKGVV